MYSIRTGSSWSVDLNDLSDSCEPDGSRSESPDSSEGSDSSSDYSSGLSSCSYPDLHQLTDYGDSDSENSIKIWKCVFLIKQVRWATKLREPKGADLVPFCPRKFSEQMEMEEWRAGRDPRAYTYLPDEILLKIIDHVQDDPTTFFCLRQVSRRFRALANGKDFEDHFLSTYHDCTECNNTDMRCAKYQRIGISQKISWGVRRRPQMRSGIRAALRRDNLCGACQYGDVMRWVFPAGEQCGCLDVDVASLESSEDEEDPGYESEEYQLEGADETDEYGDYEHESDTERYAEFGINRHEPR